MVSGKAMRFDSEKSSIISKDETPIPRVNPQNILKIRQGTDQSSRIEKSELRSLRQETPASLLASYDKKQAAHEQREFARKSKETNKSSVL